MQIVQITNDFPPNIGGMATHVWELSRALTKIGHKVTVLTGVEMMRQRRRFVTEKVKYVDGVEIINFGFRYFLRRYYDHYWMRRIRFHLRRIKKGKEKAVLHLHDYPPLKFRKISSFPVIWTNHSSMFLKEIEAKSIRQELNRIISDFTWITAPSRELCHKSLMLDFPADRISYIPNGVDVDKFHTSAQRFDRRLQLGSLTLKFSENQCVVLCARRFVYKNGLHVYLDSLEALPKTIVSKCVFIFAGNNQDSSNSYEKEIEERIKRVSRKVTCYLLGAVPHEEMPHLYRIADISVLPSLIEATSISGLEAMASGIPIVGTDVGGIPEILDHMITGLLCKPNDHIGLMKNLRALILNASMRKQLGKKARSVVENRFAWSIIADNFISTYENAISSLEQR